MVEQIELKHENDNKIEFLEMKREEHQNNDQSNMYGGETLVFNLTNLGLQEQAAAGNNTMTKEGSLSKIQQNAYDNENSKDCMESLLSKMNMLNALCDTPDHGDIIQSLSNTDEPNQGPGDQTAYS